MTGLPALAEFPEPYNSERDTTSAPMPAAEATAKFSLPPGFKASLFASEPDLQNPVAMSWDARGRLWVVENYTYAEREKKLELGLRDRVLIFEGTNGHGRFGSRKVFTDEVQVATSVEVGHGGVWLMCPPKLLFIPDVNGDDLPDAPPVVLLDGFTVPGENYHGFANGLRFGPDGWLYGRCGASAPGEIGAPGTVAAERVPLRGTIWRYHPQRKIFEALSAGTTNPWGHDWDENGELFFINTVNGHLWHGIPGAHYVRSHTIDPNPRAYGLIDQHADHWHFDTSQDWTKSRAGAANGLGGGHAHVGTMIYQGDNWPAEFRGHLFTWNMHGRRMNQEILVREGSGYIARHGEDIALAEDPWFRGIEMSAGPDGGVFSLDWSDTGECHEATGVHRASGRIFKITYGEPKSAGKFDLAKMSLTELVNLHTWSNDWWVRQARLELAGRAARGHDVENAATALREMFGRETNKVYQLRALWTLHAMGLSDENFLLTQFHHSSEHVRTWAIRLLADSWPLDTVLSQRPAGTRDVRISDKLIGEFSRLARDDKSGLVRLALASALQRLPVPQRAGLAAQLVAHAEDAGDHNLPLMIWYGLIPLGDSDPGALAKLGADCELPVTLRCIARRLAEDVEKSPAPLEALLATAAERPTPYQTSVLAGISEGLSGWSKARKPATWDALSGKLIGSDNSEIRALALNLGVIFGDALALEEVKRVALDSQSPLPARKAALQALVENRPPDLRTICEGLLEVASLNSIAIRGLARFDDPAIGEKLVKGYSRFAAPDRAAVIDTLVTRPAFAKFLLLEVAAGRISRSDITPYHARQIRGLNNEAITMQLKEAWGELRDSSGEKKEQIVKLKEQLTPEILKQADTGRGRLVFNNLCGACHKLYGQGGVIGPDLTGSGRQDLDYLLDNIVDPSAVVGADFRMNTLHLKDGRTLSGYIAAKTERTLTLKTMTESVSLERSEITSLQESPLSIMPEGLFGALDQTQTRDLIAYLMGKFQVPLPGEGN